MGSPIDLKMWSIFLRKSQTCGNIRKSLDNVMPLVKVTRDVVIGVEESICDIAKGIGSNGWLL